MKSRNWTVPLLAAALLTGLVTAVIVHRATFAFCPADDFFQIRNSVYSLLHERANTPIDGVTIILPPTESSLQEIAKPFPDDTHIQNVVRGGDWLGGGGFQLLLNLEDSALPTDRQGYSKTMTATVLLNHYFSDLEKLGLRRRGSPGVVMGRIQSAQNEWFSEPDQFVSVEATVFVSRESQQAIVIGRVRERLANR
jgi:hypothetical protein